VHLSLPLLTVLEERLVLVKPLTEGALLGDLKASAMRISPCFIRVLHAQDFLLMRADQDTGVTGIFSDDRSADLTLMACQGPPFLVARPSALRALATLR
jgi:hypothetical protein